VEWSTPEWCVRVRGEDGELFSGKEKGGYCCHVLNRGNARQTDFFKDGDCLAFIELLNETNKRVSMRLLAWHLKPNHFHLVLWPRRDGDLSDSMVWLMTAHVRRCHQHDHSSGQVGQDRVRDFRIQEGDHLLTVLRYKDFGEPGT
jgi:putative transposase